MANVGVTTFQGSPCDLDWYNYFKNLTDHRDLECTVHFCEPKLLNDEIHTRMFPVAIASNLQCKNQTTYLGNGKLTNYTLPVHQLVSMNATDEIDPRCLETKIPSASFSFKVEGIDHNTPLATVDALLNAFDDKMVRIYRGFNDPKGKILDDNGRWALDYYAGFDHDLVCLGNYKIVDREYNYEKCTIEVQCEHIFFNKFAEDDTYKAMHKTGDPAKTAVLYQRYPYPYSATTVEGGGDSTHPTKVISSYKLGYNAWEMLRSTSYAKLGSNSIPLYGWAFPDTTMASYGVNTGGFIQGVETSYTAAARVWNLAAENDLQQIWDTTTPFTRTLDVRATLCQLNNTWKKESALETLLCWNLMNCIHWVPARPLQKLQEETQPISNDVCFDGTWTIMQGLSPTEDVFLDKTKISTWTMLDNGNNGTWFPAIANTVYKVLPSFLVSQSVKKENIEWEPVKWAKTYYMDLLNVPTRLSTDYYAFQNQTYFADTVDVHQFNTSAYQPYPSDQNSGFRIVTSQPLKNDTWYMNRTAEITGANNFVADLFGFDEPANNQMGEVNIPVRGDSVLAWRVLWNTNIRGLANRQPLSIGLITCNPTIYAYDANGNLVDEGSTQNTKGIDTIHAYGLYKNLSTRMIARANAGDTNVAPMYQLTWTMVDDPSLRVGTVVWVPLQNEYLKVYITKQERSFDGGARLTCTGWAYAKTGQKVYDPKITNAKCTYFVNNPDNDPKGEWFKLTWIPTGDYSPVDTVTYVFTYTDEFGAWSKTIGSTSILFGETAEYLLNGPRIAQESGIDLDELINGKGYFGITGYFPPDAKSAHATAPKTITTWDNTTFSQLHAGYIRASNQHQPLIVGNPLQG